MGYPPAPRTLITTPTLADRQHPRRRIGEPNCRVRGTKGITMGQVCLPEMSTSFTIVRGVIVVVLLIQNGMLIRGFARPVVAERSRFIVVLGMTAALSMSFVVLFLDPNPRSAWRWDAVIVLLFLTATVMWGVILRRIENTTVRTDEAGHTGSADAP
jgi:hypothetical protein